MTESIEAKVAKVEQQNKEQDRRLNNLESQTQAIQDLTNVTKQLVETVRSLANIQDSLDERIELLEREPGETLLSFKRQAQVAILSALCGGCVTYLLSNIL